MQYKDIEVFLELVNTRNITKAADNLFLAQSVISTRLKRMEEELGYELFVRSKGQREIELTDEGKEFTAIATKMQAFYEEASEIGKGRQLKLRVAAPESIFLSLLEPIIIKILHQHPEVKIEAEMADSSRVYELMEANVIDFGFASFESAHHNIIHRPVYEQDFALCMAKAPGGTVTAAMLDPEREIVFTGGNFASLEQWRSTHFPGSTESRVKVNSAIMISRCLKEIKASWAIMPTGTAEVLAEYYGVEVCSLLDPPEKRKIYLLSHSGTMRADTEAVNAFLKELSAYEIH